MDVFTILQVMVYRYQMYHIVQFKYVQLIVCQSHPNKEGHTKEKRERLVWPAISVVSFRRRSWKQEWVKSGSHEYTHKLTCPWLWQLNWKEEMGRQDAIGEAVQELHEQERGSHGRSWPRECWGFFAPQMNGASVMEGVDGGAQWDHSWGSGTWNMVRGNHCGDVRQVAGNVKVKGVNRVWRFRLHCRGSYWHW